MELVDNKIIVNQEEDLRLCSLATQTEAGRASIGAVEMVEGAQIIIGEKGTKSTLCGLARIALGEFGPSYHWASQELASDNIDSLCGTADGLLEDMDQAGYFKE